MRRFWGWVTALAALCAGAPALAQDTLTVMSLNIRYPNPGDGANVWEKRRDLTIATIRVAAPDLIGTQELYQRQGDDIVRALPHYGWFGTDRYGGHSDEHMGIFYRRDRLKMVEHGQFWLSETPEKPGSMSWGIDLPRLVNWAVFETRDGRRFRFYDTHFPHRDQDEAAREQAARLLAARIAEAPKDQPVILTGDFNTVDSSAAHRALTEGLADAWLAQVNRQGPSFTFHDFTGRGDRRIDWILTRGFAVAEVATVATHRGAVFPSDHYPVVARVRFDR
ncbi:endonuclease/exonuclease/phosphatase family protein [Sphingomonas sp. R1]|uniref:endonuclease/exonuclease/phosphatase family protein n=1 Tax=Sphingomonas sp. R1 TaxID=399176 RepID=UPI0022240F36|nr:endonuclease/exonuclease/phosphatase family protein [Sphingomonas sp. R1]UYY76513.1 endonuclease/exonuclease/phosphatase family protein [Sphingomonas sp. R1]